MLKKIDTLWGKFEDSRIGSYILRKKSYYSIVGFFGTLFTAQIALYNSQNYWLEAAQRQADSTEGMVSFIWSCIAFFIPDGNIVIIVVSLFIVVMASLIRYRELLPFRLRDIFTKEVLESANTNNPLGRDKDVEDLKEKLETNSAVVLINGIGGIGKSVLAHYYAETQKSYYAYRGFVVAKDNLKINLVNAMDFELVGNTIDERFEDALGKLRQTSGKKLLVIDDIKEPHLQQKSIISIKNLSRHNVHILFTSRNSVSDTQEYYLGAIDIEFARALFRRFYPTDETSKIDKILGYIDSHTLFIPLIATTMKINNYSFEDIFKKFESQEMSQISLTNQQTGETETLNKNLQALFDIQGLSDEYVLLLQRFSLLPTEDIALEFLERFFKEDDLKGKLEYLTKQGWLSGDGENNYKIHEIIKSFILTNYTPNREEIETQYSFMHTLAKESDMSDGVVQKYENITYFHSFANSLKLLSIQDKQAVEFYGNFAIVYYALGDYTTALEYLTKSLAISEEIGDKAGEGATLNNMATASHAQGDYNTALEYLTKSLAIREEIGDKAGEGTTLNNISQIYDAQGDYNTALEYLTKSLAIREEIGDKAGMCATLFNMGHIAWGAEEHQKALGYWVEVHSIASGIGAAQALDALAGLGKQLAPALSMEYGDGFWDEVAKRVGV